jgi:hypothetical protein
MIIFIRRRARAGPTTHISKLISCNFHYPFIQLQALMSASIRFSMNRNRECIRPPASAGLRGKRVHIKIRLKVLTVESRLGRTAACRNKAKIPFAGLQGSSIFPRRQ